MKITKLYTAIALLFAVACSPGNSVNEHSHDGDAKHEHAEDTEGKIEKSDEVMITEREDSIVLTVPAKKGIEYKFQLKQYERLSYEWTADVPLYFDFHGEPMDYDETGYFESYTEATSSKMRGIMTTPFEGSHGWYWKNNSDQDVSVKLKTKGKYTINGLRQ